MEVKMEYFKGMDFNNFWNDDEYSLEKYVDEKPSGELRIKLEQELGYKLPNSYVKLMEEHNGGTPNKNCYLMNEKTSWANDHIQIEGIWSFGVKKMYSIGGEYGSKYMIQEWEYPEIGIIICDTPDAGHTVVMLDYRKCGKIGEPEIVYVDTEDDNKITFVAKNFEIFILGLKEKSYFKK
jgi:hypothetical protein